MNIVTITLENSVLQTDVNSLVSIRSPRLGYVEIIFSEKPKILEGVVEVRTNMRNQVILLLPYSPRMIFNKVWELTKTKTKLKLN